MDSDVSPIIGIGQTIGGIVNPASRPHRGLERQLVEQVILIAVCAAIGALIGMAVSALARKLRSRV
jgi:hypothetical protein